MVGGFSYPLVLITACVIAGREEVVRADGRVTADGGVEPVIEMIVVPDRVASVYNLPSSVCRSFANSREMKRLLTQYKWAGWIIRFGPVCVRTGPLESKPRGVALTKQIRPAYPAGTAAGRDIGFWVAREI